MRTVAALTPIERTPGDHAANVVHNHLRRLILDGVLAAGTSINQVTLASELGVSRTPVREAIRMLQEEGLVEAQPQKRAHVAGFDPFHLETVYTERVLLESLAASITAQQASDQLIAALEQSLLLLDREPEQRLAPDWRAEHNRFHLNLVSGVHPQLQRAIRNNMDRGEHYRLNYRVMYEETGTRVWDTSPAEHRAIVDAFRRHDSHEAAAELAAHLARTALSLIAQTTPTYNPAALRAALELYHD
jgi:DNA-binding GntR family transcriptional regulator